MLNCTLKWGLFTLFVMSSFMARAEQSLNPVTLDWKPQLYWSGDLRFRVAKSKESIDDERNYQQLRARLGVRADVDSDLSLVLRLATGTSAISTNQTLGDPKDPGMPRRSFGLDQAYISWKFADESLLWAGRVANPFWAPSKESLIFDSDISFEGVAAKWEPQWSHSKAFFNVGGFIISENYDSTARQDVVDTGIVGAQVGYSEKTDWGTGTLHLGYFNYLNIQDKEITNIQKDAQTDPYSIPYDRYRGNIVYRPDPVAKLYYYQDKFIIRDIGAEWKYEFEPYSVIAFFDAAENTEADTLKRASEYGLAFKWGRAQLSWAWFEKQAESVVGAFTDSDINGGGVDNRGTRLSFNYQLSKYSQIFLTQYQAKRGIDSVERDFSSTMLDVIVVF